MLRDAELAYHYRNCASHSTGDTGNAEGKVEATFLSVHSAIDIFVLRVVELF